MITRKLNAQSNTASHPGVEDSPSGYFTQQKQAVSTSLMDILNLKSNNSVMSIQKQPHLISCVININNALIQHSERCYI